MGQWRPVEGFGQESPSSCALACLRYLLDAEGVALSEADLRQRLEPHVASERSWDPHYDPTDDGYSEEALALLCLDLGFRPRLRRLAGIKPHPMIPVDWLEVGTAEQLQSWLCEMVEAGRLVKVALAGHSVVVLEQDDKQVRIFDPDPKGQKGHPKTGGVESLTRDDFLRAWDDSLCSALYLEKPVS